MDSSTQWCVIEEFPCYEVSNTGFVRNIKTERYLKIKLNQYGVVGVGLMRDGIQFHRSLPLLVARAFLPRWSLSAFDTPINLDGDRSNNDVSNLLWRPRWFAVLYNRQFIEGCSIRIDAPIADIHHPDIVFANSFVCATQLGLLEKDLVFSILNRTYVWPTYHEFGVIGKAFR